MLAVDRDPRISAIENALTALTVSKLEKQVSDLEHEIAVLRANPRPWLSSTYTGSRQIKYKPPNP